MQNTETTSLTVKYQFHTKRDGSRTVFRTGKGTVKSRPKEGSLPKITRLLAIAHRMREMIEQGEVADQAELARTTGLTRARITQIMNLLLLAPEIQEKILFMPRVERGQDPVTEKDVRQLSGVVEWGEQMAEWKRWLM